MRHYMLHVFGIPTLLAILGLVGLVSALLADGTGDLLSWLTLGTQVVVIAVCWLRPSR